MAGTFARVQAGLCCGSRRGSRSQVWQLGAAPGKGNGNLNSSVSSQTAAASRQLPPSVFCRRPTSLPSWFELTFLEAWLSKKLRDASLEELPNRIRAFRSQLNCLVI